MKKLSIALDCDDVLYACNKDALARLNERKGTNYRLEDITAWGKLGNELDERLESYNDPEFYRSETLMPGAQEFVRRLTKIAEVFIITSTPPQCMGQRISRLITDFPEIPVENIFMGSRKSLLHMDILLDDGLHNIRQSNADYPVLFRQPWNHSASGILSVNTYDEFLTLVKTIMKSGYPYSNEKAKLLCIVGPSGSGKSEIIHALTDRHRVSKVRSYTTQDALSGGFPGKKPANNYYYMDEKEFAQQDFFEQTVYGGYRFGTKIEDVKKSMISTTAVIALDICGCMAMKRLFQDDCRLVFIRRDKEDMVGDILDRRYETNEEKKKRILSLDVELKNAELCDYVVEYHGSANDAADEIAKAFNIA